MKNNPDLPIPWDDIDPLIEAALREDLGDDGDVTTDAIVPDDLTGEGTFIVKEGGVVAGLPVAGRVFYKVDAGVACSFGVEEGEKVQENDVLGSVRGPVRRILRAERTALNLLQRLSGIATRTARFVAAVEGTGATILDTRKTTPRMRWLEKYAVLQGGAQNHRFGLFDMVLIKDNHIAAASGIATAVERCLDWLKREGKDLRVEVETRNLDEVQEAIRFPVHRIMLDNMDIPEMKRAVEAIGGRAEVEASGNITLENVRAVAETGVDFISVGSLTHSVKALDISLNMNF
jgi:nicotinate-nucleotide pyrophosphorylase (carboxylating)